MDWQTAAKTHVGKVRKLNEDACFVQQDYPLLAVADGMGGHQAGDVASMMIVERLAALALDADLDQARAQVERSLLETNEEIIAFCQRELNGVTAGSTVVTLLAQGCRGFCLWAGDSRLYRFRDDKLEQISEDHSQVAEMVRLGLLSAEEARDHPASNVITRAIGALPSNEVEITSFSVRPGDIFLLCSDGLYNEISDAEIQRVLQQQGEDMTLSAQTMLNLCLQRTAKDNITIVLARACVALSSR